MSTIVCIQILVLGYILGSVPFGILLAKLYHLPDPRYIGSGNIGATNMLRTGRKDVAALTLLLDAGKGALAVLITYQLFGSYQVYCFHAPCGPVIDYEYGHTKEALAVFAAAMGHMYSPWLKFKGGKGMATILGGTLAFSWPVGMVTLVIWILLCYTTRYVSVASITALALAPLITWLRIDTNSALILALASAVAIWRHRSNIGRLYRGFEPKVKFGKGD